MTTFEEQMNKELLKVWEENSVGDENEVYMPKFYSNLLKNKLLFIGINPSFNSSKINNLFKLLTKNQYNANEYFKWTNRENFSTKLSNDLDDKIRKDYPYFKRFREIAEYTQIEWEHIDLFHNRLTKQNKLKEIIFTNKRTRELNKFGKDQIKIFKKIIAHISPQLIVVANALASNIFENEFKVAFKNDAGYHVIQINKKTVPLFFSSMLTGGRALDNYSYKRLKWHIQKALKDVAQTKA